MERIRYEGREYVIAANLAKERGVTARAIYQAIDQGRLTAVSLVGRRLVPFEEAAVWFPAQRGGARPGAGRRKKETQ
jgi:hypothetical protein